MRRRLRSRELHAAETIGAGDALVRLRADDWLRAEDAAAMLSVSTSTVRAGIHRGALNGKRRDKGGRWLVELRSVLEDPRCDPAAVALFTTGAEVEEVRPDPPAPAEHRLSRPVFIRVYEDELELLDRGRDRHGSHRAAVVAGLRAIDHDEDRDPAEVAVERELFLERATRAEAEHAALEQRTSGRLVDEVYCPGCERLVPIDELELNDAGSEYVELMHPHRKPRRSAMVARRRAGSDAGG